MGGYLDRNDRKIVRANRMIYADQMTVTSEFIREAIDEKSAMRYSASLVYWRIQDTMLRVLITKANSSEEVLGLAISFFSEDTAGYSLILKAVVKL